MNFQLSRLLRNTRIRTKLLVIVIVPLLGLGFLAVGRSLDRKEEVSSATTLGNVIHVGVAIGNLLHHTQRERGMSSGFITSRGQKFAGQIDEQRGKTDKALAELRAIIEARGTDLPEVVRSRMSEAFGALDPLTKIRTRIKAFEIDAQEEIGYFNTVNQKLLDSLGAVASVTPDAELGRLAIGYVAFLTAKENTGTERAQLTNVFAAGKFSDDAQYQTITALLAKRNTYVDVFLNTTSAAIATAYRDSTTEAGFVQTAAFEKLALEQGSKGVFTVDPERWFDTVTSRIDSMKALEDKQAQQLIARANDTASAARRGLVLAVVFSTLLVLVAIGLAFLIIRDVTIPLEEMTAAATKIAAGDVRQTVTYEATNELGKLADAFRAVGHHHADLQTSITDLLRVVAVASDGDLTVRAPVKSGAIGNVCDAFNALLESLQELVGQVSVQIANSERFVTAVRLNAEAMQSGANVQAKEIIDATKLVEQMNEEIKRVSQGAGVAVDAAKLTEASASDGAKAVDHVISGMGTLRANVQAGAKKMKNLGDRSMEITGIVATISRISEQTNMLALNAAIEAARAGEHGRGFTVVADEVRKLAERTATATRDIDRLVKAIHAETNETVAAIEQQTQVVEREVEAVGEAGQSLKKIHDASTQSSTVVVGISTIAREQASRTGLVVQTMERISTIAKEAQAGAVGTSSTVAELAAMSQQLQESVNRFKVV
jgi:methyl-accepting chemotaxis protein